MKRKSDQLNVERRGENLNQKSNERQNLSRLIEIQCRPQGLEFAMGDVTFTISEYANHITENLRTFGNIALMISMNRSLKTSQIHDMMKQLLSVGDGFQDLNTTVDQTKLLALNTLISASQCGISGETFADIVKQVNLLCNQSQLFLEEVEESLQNSHSMLSQVVKLINKTIQSESNVVSVLKGQADTYVGKLLAHESYFLESFSLHNKEDRLIVQQSAVLQSTQDLKRVTLLLQKIKQHLIKLKNNYKHAASESGELMPLIEKFDFLQTAKIEIKTFDAADENPQFGLC